MEMAGSCEQAEASGEALGLGDSLVEREGLGIVQRLLEPA